MENRFTLRRGDTPPSTENLMEYELGWDKQGKRLYMNDGGESVSLMMHEDEIVQLIYERTFNWIYPVGSLYWSMNNVDPSTLFPGTTWEQIQNRFVYAAGSDTQSGELGGATDGKITLSLDELPEHLHEVNGATSSGGSQTANGTTDFTGDHTHSRGSMNITGHLGFRSGDGFDIAVPNDIYGAFSHYYSGPTITAENSTSRDSGCQIDFNAADTWSGNTSQAGNHTHTVNINISAHEHNISLDSTSVGESKPFSIMPPYITAYCWKRIS